jgi:uncharacterized protein YdeI (YjbR/CyaY-like superfamily)
VKPTFFRGPTSFRRWLEKNHATAGELLVGFYRKDSGKPSITWPESVDEALCFGWIDGIRRSIDESSYSMRFSPRKPRSIWSAVNVKRANELIELGLMQPAGLEAFERRDAKKTAIYAYEQKNAAFDARQERMFKANRAAWKFFQAQPAGYRRLAAWYVLSAKREETRAKRLATLIADSEAGQRIGLTRRPETK